MPNSAEAAGPSLDIRAEIDAGKLGPAHWLLVATLGLVTMFDGYDVFAPAYVIPFGFKEWMLKPSQAGLLVSSGLVGFMIGAIACGPIADRIGRKPTLLAALAWAALLNIVTAFYANSFGSFLALRVLTGLGLGMLLPLSVTLINEIVPRRSTNLLVGCMMIGWSVGGVLAALAALALTPTHGWHALFWIGIPTLPLALACAFTLRESPRFLALRGRTQATRTVMSQLNPERADVYANADFGIAEPAGRKGSIRRLFAADVARSTTGVWICAAFSLFTIYGLSAWVPQAMIQRGEGFAASFGFGALLQVMAALGGVALGWAADRYERKTVATAAWLVAAVAIAGLALLNLHWTNLLFISIAGFCCMGAQPVLNNLTACLYPTEIRSTGVGTQLGVGRLGGILGPYIGGWLQQVFPGTLALFLAMTVAVLVSIGGLTLIRHKTVSPEF